jgi:phosphoribosyl-AMP cyclohydrolase
MRSCPQAPVRPLVGRDGGRVVPVVLQDAGSGDVLFIGYANEQALEASVAPSGSSRPGCYYRAITENKTLRHRA